MPGNEQAPKGEPHIADYLGVAELAIYLLVSAFLVVMALLTLFMVARDLSGAGFPSFSLSIIENGIRDILSTLIILELIQTVVVYLKSHRIDIRLILAAGLTAMIRRVLVFGVENITPADEIATAILIAVLIAAIVIIGNRKISVKHFKEWRE